MDAELIKTLLKEKGITQGMIRRKWKRPNGRFMSKATISDLVNRKMTSRRLERRLARLLGMTLEEFRGDFHSSESLMEKKQ